MATCDENEGSVKLLISKRWLHLLASLPDILHTAFLQVIRYIALELEQFVSKQGLNLVLYCEVVKLSFSTMVEQWEHLVC